MHKKMPFSYILSSSASSNERNGRKRKCILLLSTESREQSHLSRQLDSSCLHLQNTRLNFASKFNQRQEKNRRMPSNSFPHPILPLVLLCLIVFTCLGEWYTPSMSCLVWCSLLFQLTSTKYVSWIIRFHIDWQACLSCFFLFIFLWLTLVIKKHMSKEMSTQTRLQLKMTTRTQTIKQQH